MRKKIDLLAFLFILSQTFLASSSRFVFANEPVVSDSCSKDAEIRVEKKIGSYRVRISYAEDRTCQRLEIFNLGKVAFSEEGFDLHYFLGNDPEDREKRFLFKMTGRGTQLVVKKWTGGAHCCNSLLVFDLGNEFRKVAEIYGGNYDLKIVDLNHDGIPEIRLTDDFLAERFSSFAYSATAEVVLKYASGRYVIAPELMRKPAPLLKSLNAKIPGWQKLLRKHDPDWPPPSLIQTITDLVFTGNEKDAFDLMERVWLPEIAGKSDFLKSYRQALAESEHYAEFARTQKTSDTGT